MGYLSDLWSWLIREGCGVVACQTANWGVPLFVAARMSYAAPAPPPGLRRALRVFAVCGFSRTQTRNPDGNTVNVHVFIWFILVHHYYIIFLFSLS